MLSWMKKGWLWRFFATVGLLLVALACCPPTLLQSPVASSTPSPTLTLTPYETPISVATPVVRGTPPSDPEGDRRYRIFREVWNTVMTDYVSPDHNGVDWPAVRREFGPRVEAVPDDETFWLLMQEMIDRLGDDHSAFLSPEAAHEEDTMMTGELDYVGIGIYVDVPAGADYGVVFYPLPGGPAEAAGVRAHDRLLAINGEPVRDLQDGSDPLALLSGEPGTPVTLSLRHPGEPVREVVVTRARVQSAIPISTRRISTPAGDVAYMLVPSFNDFTMGARVREALESLLDEGPVVGVVVDVRINGGGLNSEMYDLLSLFAGGEMGHFRTRGDEVTPLVVPVDPVAGSDTLPLVVLIGRDTASCGELFSGILQSRERATLIGQPTSGNVETVYPYDQEDGSRLWLAVQIFEPLTGGTWEGLGVQPDLLVEGDWEDFSEEDPQLDAAIDHLIQ